MNNLIDSDGVLDVDDRCRLVFFPHAMHELQIARERKSRFVHYTTAEAAQKIIVGKEFWLRKTSTMNDFTEVEHGIECLDKAYGTEAGEKLKSALNKIFPGLSEKLEAAFKQHLATYQNHTYITCVSKHLDHEDLLGRLSMWRAYGGKAGVAIVLKSDALLSNDGQLKIYSTPKKAKKGSGSFKRP